MLGGIILKMFVSHFQNKISDYMSEHLKKKKKI